MAGKLKIIDSNGELIPDLEPREILLKSFNEDESQKLLEIFNEELNDLEKIFRVKRGQEGPKVEIYCNPAKETKCQREVDRLLELVQGLNVEGIDCRSQIKSKDDILRILNKEVGVVCIPSKMDGNILRIYAKNKNDLYRATKKLTGSVDKTGHKASSREGRSFSNHSYGLGDSDVVCGGREARATDGVKTFRTSNGLIVKIYRGAITKLSVDAVVNAANEHLANGAGVAGALSKAGGHNFDKECHRFIQKNGTIPVTKNVVTGAGAMNYDGVIHAVGPQWYSYRDKVDCVKDVRKTVVEILNTSEKSGYRNVAMPPISSGLFGVPTDLCAAMYVLGIIDFSKNVANLNSLKEFHIIDIKDEILNMVMQYYQEWKQNPSALSPSMLVSQHPEVNKGDNYNRSWEDKKDWNTRQGRWHSQSQTQGHGGSQGHNQSVRGSSCNAGHQGSKDYNHSYGRGQGRYKGCDGSQGYPDDHSQQNRGRQQHIEPPVKKDAGSFIFRRKLKVLIYSGNILHCNVEAIVATDGRDKKGAISTALEKENGSSLWTKFKDISNVFSSKHLGQITTVKPNKMKHLRCIYYIIMNRFSRSVPPSLEQLRYLKSIVLRLLAQANEFALMDEKRKKKSNYQPLEKMAMSIPGAGSLETPQYVEKCSEVMFEAFEEFTWKNKQIYLKEVHLVDLREDVITKVLQETFNKKVLSLRSLPLPPPHQPTPLRKTQQFEVSGHYDTIPYEGSMRKLNPEQNRKIDEWKSKACSRTLDIDQYVTKKKGNMKIIGGDYSTKQGGSTGATCGDDTEDGCIICMDTFDEPVKLKKCGHMFCKDCISESFKQKPVCPVCTTVYTVVQGDQPVDGIACVYEENSSLPGYSGNKTLIINYVFSDGTQDEEHPNPRCGYKGLNRKAYLPGTKKGREVLQMLKEAFEQRLIFTIGQSRTTGENNVVTWNDIHHKTRREGGSDRFGYPDDNYLDRVTEELNAKGIGL
ncbi:uncharacterized protein LOC132549586 [Ylistrum balloti]|uniref:uncharacterized protein LOC132549586 n=1 Tax=Ylistrum balloti TaxID=509963 RepID=UPI002905EF77|nr:uncharacterized protein LOC132549586 [Ylistrum balloti]